MASFFKFVLLGDTKIGKTFILNNNTNSQTTIGCDIKNITINNYKNKTIKIQIWDTPGIEKYRTYKENIYKNSDAIILCYNTNNINSFINLRYYLAEINKYNNNTNLIILLFAIGDNNNITQEIATNFANNNKIFFKSCDFSSAVDYILEKIIK